MRDKLIEDLSRAFSGNELWERIPSSVLNKLIANVSMAKSFPSDSLYGREAQPLDQLIQSSTIRIQRILELSELFHLEEKWIQFSKGNPSEALSLISACFEDLGYQLVDEATNLANGKRTRDFGDLYNKAVRESIQSTGNPELSVHMTTAELAYQSAILCDPFALNCYVSLAGLYLASDSERIRSWARDVCRLFDLKEVQLLNAEESELNFQQRLLRQNHNGNLDKVNHLMDGVRKTVDIEFVSRQKAAAKNANFGYLIPAIEREAIHQYAPELLEFYALRVAAGEKSFADFYSSKKLQRPDLLTREIRLLVYFAFDFGIATCPMKPDLRDRIRDYVKVLITTAYDYDGAADFARGTQEYVSAIATKESKTRKNVGNTFTKRIRESRAHVASIAGKFWGETHWFIRTWTDHYRFNLPKTDQSGDKPGGKSKALCKKCGKVVVPTFHSCCPECGESF